MNKKTVLTFAEFCEIEEARASKRPGQPGKRFTDEEIEKMTADQFMGSLLEIAFSQTEGERPVFVVRIDQ